MQRAARLLLYAGIVEAVLGLGKIHAAYIGHYDLTGSSRFAWALAYIAILGVTAYGVGLPDLVRGRSAVGVSAVAAGSAALGISLVQLLVGDALLPRFVVFGSALLLVPWYAACVRVATGGRANAEERDRVALVAGEDEVAALRGDLAQAPERNAQLVAVMDTDAARAPDTKRKPLVEELLHSRATVLVLDRVAQADESVVSQAAKLHEAGIRVRPLSLFYEEWLGKLPISELERMSLMFDIGELHRARYGRLKRLLDVVAGALGMVALVVVTPFVVIGDLLANRGTLFYRQVRVGKNGRLFEILKFRTMRAGDGVPVNEWTTEDDPRITPFGRVLRVTHLDELPQVWNILRGELSLVGPRPEQPQYVEELARKIPFYDLRHLVRPGLTGWAQVKYGYAGTESDALEKLQYEFFYLRRQSLALDLRIVGRTIRSVIGRGGR